MVVNICNLLTNFEVFELSKLWKRRKFDDLVIMIVKVSNGTQSIRTIKGRKAGIGQLIDPESFDNPNRSLA
jgi:hypothetical protein